MEITRKRIDRLGKTFSKSCNTFLESEFYIQLDSSVIETISHESLKNFSEGY